MSQAIISRQLEKTDLRWFSCSQHLPCIALIVSLNTCSANSQRYRAAVPHRKKLFQLFTQGASTLFKEGKKKKKAVRAS